MRTPLCVLCVVGVAVLQLAAQPPVKRRTTPEVWHPQLEQFTPAGIRQVEFGCALSEAGYQKLRAALPWSAPTERADYYFDAYDGQQFLLRTGETPLKVRIKVKKRKPHWQISRFVDKDQVRVGDLVVKVHATESWEARLKTRDVAPLLEASDDFARRLADGGPRLRKAADRVDAAWRTLRGSAPPPGLMVLDRLLEGRTYRFYPRKVTLPKTRLIAALPRFPGRVVTLMLGSEPEVDANGQPTMAYELEAETEDDGPVSPADAKSIAAAIARLLQRAGLHAADQVEVFTLSNDYTLRQLAR